MGLSDPLLAALRPLSKRIVFAFVYGSIAKGDANANSDVDLFVVANDLTLEELFRRLAPAEKKLGRKVHATLCTPAEYERRRKGGNAFLQKVIAGKHIVLIGHEDDAPESR